MKWESIAIGAAAGLGAYIFGQLILFKTSVDAVDYWEAQGYINGLVRGAGDASTATSHLNYWRDYWISVSGWASFIINHFYNYGLQRISELYGSSAAVAELVQVD